MFTKKINKVKIAVVASIILIAIIAVILSLIVFTDTFKSNKEIFVKNVTQFLSQEDVSNNSLMSYMNKRQTTPNKNKGEISISNINMEDIKKEDIPKIAFEGQNDPNKKIAEQNIEIKYSDDVKFPISYKNSNDIYGIQTEYVSSKYIAIENNNLKELAKKLGINTYTIPDKIEIGQEKTVEQFTAEEKQELKEKYSVIWDKISEDKILSAKTQTGKRYTLVLTQKEVQDIAVEFFEMLKNDEILLNKVSSNPNMQTQIKEYLEQMIKTMRSSFDEEEGSLQVIVETENNKPVKIEIQIPELIVAIQKSQEKDNLTYTINLTNMEDAESSVCTLIAEFKGLGKQEEVTENYKLKISTTNGKDRCECEYNYANTVTFVENVDVETLTTDNAMILNECSTEQIVSIIQMLAERITQVNSDQMKELGIENGENPLMGYLAPFMMGEQNSLKQGV